MNENKGRDLPQTYYGHGFWGDGGFWRWARGVSIGWAMPVGHLFAEALFIMCT